MQARNTILATSIALAASTLAARDGHQHGVASLDVVIEGAIVALEFHSPAYDLVGFEHAPRDADQQRRVEDAVATLAEGAGISVRAGDDDCTRVDSRTGQPFSGEAERHDESESHDDHGHGDKHDREQHSDFFAEWTFDCGDRVMSQIAVDVFDRFTSIQRVRVRSIGPEGQSATDLTVDSRVFTP